MSSGILFFGRKTCNFSHVIRQQLFQKHLARALVCVRQRSSVFQGIKALALLGNERKFLVILEICQNNKALLDSFIWECTLQYLEVFLVYPAVWIVPVAAAISVFCFFPTPVQTTASQVRAAHCISLLQCSLELQENSGLHEEVVFEIVDLDYSGSSGLQDALLMFIISPVSSQLDTQFALLCCFALLLFCERTDI